MGSWLTGSEEGYAVRAIEVAHQAGGGRGPRRGSSAYVRSVVSSPPSQWAPVPLRVSRLAAQDHHWERHLRRAGTGRDTWYGGLLGGRTLGFVLRAIPGAFGEEEPVGRISVKRSCIRSLIEERNVILRSIRRATSGET